MIKEIPGIYALVFYLAIKKTITIGKLGRFAFEPGWYVYLGSAHGPGGVKARTNRHRRVEKKLRWNVDHFRCHATLVEIWFSHDVHERECQWAQALAGIRGASVPVDGFGSHDCDCCPAHLIRFDQRPVAQLLRHTLAANHPEHEPIYVESLISADPSEIESPMLQKYLRGNLYIEMRRRAVYDCHGALKTGHLWALPKPATYEGVRPRRFTSFPTGDLRWRINCKWPRFIPF